MALSFKDIDGTNGRVTQPLNVEYEGKWKKDVEKCVQDIEEDLGTNRGENNEEQPYTQLVLALPEEAPIVKVEQTDSR